MSNLFRSVGLDDLILRHGVVEGLLLVHLVADPLALCHILLDIDCFLTRGQGLVYGSTFLFPAHVGNSDIPEHIELLEVALKGGYSNFSSSFIGPLGHDIWWGKH